MAMQAANSAAALPSSQVVGNAFVEQYYQILHLSPDLVHKFYLDSSVLTRPDSKGVMTSVTTMQAINDMILSLDYKNYNAEIKTADAQDSFKDGVIVLVTGCLTGKDNVRRKFTQTFFLAPQEKGYYVLNDVFRFIDESEPLEVSSGLDSDVNDNAPTASMPLDTELTRAPDHHALVPGTTFEVEDLNDGAEVCDPSDDDEGSVLEGEVVDELPTYSSQKEITQGVSVEPSAVQEEKKSYASIVKVTKVGKTSTPVYVPISRVRLVSANADQQSIGSPKPLSTQSEASGPTSDSAPESKNVHEEVKGHSVYVRNLPLSVTVTQLEEEFRKFGPIKLNGIQVRFNKEFCFGFVEFELLRSVQDAIKASPITIEGRPAVVEEKRATTRVGSGGGRGRYPSGRGGFRNDYFRNRGNFGGGGGGRGGYYGRNEYRNQGEFSGRSRGPNARSGETTYQRVDHNRSERGGHQDGTNKSSVSSQG